MKKSDLKTGMVIETRQGGRGLVMLGTPKGDIIGACNSSRSVDREDWCDLSQYTDNLTKVNSGPDRDIVRVYNSTTNHQAADIFSHREILWERASFTKGKWYKKVDMDYVSFTFTIGGSDNEGDPLGYGLFRSAKTQKFRWCPPNGLGWKIEAEATNDEVKEVLVEESIRRGIVKGAYVGAFDGHSKIKYQKISENDTYSFYNNTLSIEGGAESGCLINIFKDGQWIEVLETITKEEAIDKLKKVIID